MTPAEKIAKAVEYITWYCASANLGYDQWNRWDYPPYGDWQTPGECDCSSLVAKCLNMAGFNVPINGNFVTGNERTYLERAGFRYVPYTGTDWPFGAVLWKSGHTAMWTGKAIAEAYGDENGYWHSGKCGDQNNETRLSPKRGGWEGYFYYPIPAPVVKWPQEVEPMGDQVDYVIEEGSNNVAHETDQQSYSYRYKKWASGLLECTVSDYFNGGAGALYKGEYYMTKILEMPHTDSEAAPAFVEPPHIVGFSARASRGWVDVQFTEITPDKARFYVFGGDKNIPRFSLDVKLEGCWKK